MKILGLIIIVLFSCNLCSYSQTNSTEKWDSAYLQHYVDSTHTIPSDVDLSTLHLEAPTFINSSYDNEDRADTIKCIMLVSDSSYQSNKVVWIKGYEVKTESHTMIEANGVLSLKQFETIYLDVIKNKLPKNIIIWQAKEY